MLPDAPSDALAHTLLLLKRRVDLQLKVRKYVQRLIDEQRLLLDGLFSHFDALLPLRFQLLQCARARGHEISLFVCGE